MGSKKIAAAVLSMAFLAGCTMRTPAQGSASAYDFSERDAYGQSFAASPTYAGQDTSWTTTAPARAAFGPRHEEAPATDIAPAKAKGAEEGGVGKFDAEPAPSPSAPALPPAPPRPAPRPASPPPQSAQSPSQVGASASSR